MIKKIIATILCGATIFAFVGCSNGKVEEKPVDKPAVEESVTKVSVKDVMKKLLDSEYITSPVEADEQRATEVFGLKLDDVKEYAIAETEINAQVGTIVLVEAKDGKVDAVKECVETYLKELAEPAMGKYPAHIEAAENAKVEVKGNIVSLMVLNEEVNEEAHKALDEMLK